MMTLDIKLIASFEAATNISKDKFNLYAKN